MGGKCLYPTTGDVQLYCTSIFVTRLVGYFWEHTTNIVAVTRHDVYASVLWQTCYLLFDDCAFDSLVLISGKSEISYFILVRTQLFFLLSGILLHEVRRALEKRFTETVGCFNLDFLCRSIEFLKLREQTDITTGETIDRLPIVSHAEDTCTWILPSKRR